MTTPRHVTFQSVDEKARWLDAAASLDAASPWVQAKARFLTAYALTPSAKVRELHRFVRDSIAYRLDRSPAGLRSEAFADTKTILERLYDDCDGKVRAFIALVRALGIPGLEARVRPVHPRPGDFRHVQAEVRFAASRRHPWERATWDIEPTEDDGWTRVETIVAGVDIGADVASVRRPDGSYPMAGPGGRDGTPR